jgi:hypothetical protein
MRIGQQGAPRPTLRLLERQPLVVRGQHFKAGEHVTVALVSREERSLPVTANGDGSFTISFGDVEITRCEAFAVSARGSRGSRAALKLPQPLCLPASAPLRVPG